MPFGTGDVTITQALPIALNQVSVMAQRIGDMHLESPQIAEHREMPAQGQTYILGQGGALKAGDTLSLTFTGLPHAARWPRNLALVLAIGILGAGLWGAVKGGPATVEADARRRKLQAKRDRLFGELTSLEQQRRDGALDDDRYAARRHDLVTSLERVYAELDVDAAA